MSDKNQTDSVAENNDNSSVNIAKETTLTEESVTPKEEVTAKVTELNVSEDSVIKKDPIVVAELLPKGEKLLAAIGYISFLCILPLALRPKSKLCQLHGKQSLVITATFLIFSWLTWLSPGGFGALLGILQTLISVWGMMHAWRGKEKVLPFFGQIAKKLNWED
jgi:uncharacterized membrane protein